MAVAAKDTGHGATIAFGTSAITYAWRKIGTVTQEIESVEDTDLSTTKTYLPGDLPDTAEVEVEYCFNPTVALPNILAAAETITITVPLAVGGVVAGYLAGTGFITSITASPEYTTNGLQIGKLRFVFDGTTPPAWTATTAV